MKMRYRFPLRSDICYHFVGNVSLFVIFMICRNLRVKRVIKRAIKRISSLRVEFRQLQRWVGNPTDIFLSNTHALRTSERNIWTRYSFDRLSENIGIKQT